MMTRLNLGAGSVNLEGFEPVDRAVGKEVYPLPNESGSVAEVYASHVLEHFPQAKVGDVVKEWVRTLKPGGRIRIAVPDLRWIIKAYMNQAEVPIAGYLMGGQTDENDFHKAVFDEAGLRFLMEQAGLVGIQRWSSGVQDCASLPVSLNLEGFKPVQDTRIGERCIVVSTMPSLNHTDNRNCTTEACVKLRIPYISTSGAYFDQGMERALEHGMDREYVIAIDFDTIFTTADIERLVCLMDRNPQAGAIAAMQCKRGPDGIPLIARDTGDSVSEDEASSDIFKVKSCHFGLTIMRTATLKQMAKPWLHHVPAPDGSWGDGRVDADVAFWHKMAKVAPVYVTPRVNVGHMQRMVSWVGVDWQPVHQHMDDYQKYGKPANVRG